MHLVNVYFDRQINAQDNDIKIAPISVGPDDISIKFFIMAAPLVA